MLVGGAPERENITMHEAIAAARRRFEEAEVEHFTRNARFIEHYARLKNAEREGLESLGELRERAQAAAQTAMDALKEYLRAQQLFEEACARRRNSRPLAFWLDHGRRPIARA